MSKLIRNEDITDSLNLLLLNIPKNISTLEKIRWLYIKTGELFCYDYRIANDIKYATTPIDFSKDYINRYQTCTQIAYILNLMLNNIGNCTSRIIERKTNIRGTSGVEHVANEVTLDTGEKFILDLTLDLYLIQSGCQTKQFGYTTDIENTCDIISLKECEKMDKKLGLIKNGEYTDKKIDEIKRLINLTDYSEMTTQEQIEYKINQIEQIIPRFHGIHESKQFINKLFTNILITPYKEYNLTHIKDNEMELLTCFKIGEEDCWYLYDYDLGLIKTTTDTLKYMLSCGWSTKSQTLLEELSETSKTK